MFYSKIYESFTFWNNLQEKMNFFTTFYFIEMHLYFDRNLRTAWFEKGDFKIEIKKKHWVDFYHYRMDVYTHVQHTFMFKQLVKWI